MEITTSYYHVYEKNKDTIIHFKIDDRSFVEKLDQLSTADWSRIKKITFDYLSDWNSKFEKIEHHEIPWLEQIYPTVEELCISTDLVQLDWLGNFKNIKNLTLDVELDFIPSFILKMSTLEQLNLKLKYNDKHLKSIPPLALKQIHTLSINGANIDQLDWLKELTQLEELQLINGHLSQFDWLINFKQLKKLTLKQVDLNNIQNVVLDTTISSLEQLDIINCQLSQFDWLANFTHLEHLNLENYSRSWGVVPTESLEQQLTASKENSWLTRLTKLKQLHLKNVGLEAIPREILTMDQLEELYLKKNPIKHFPSQFTNPNLRKLEFDIDDLEEKKDCIDQRQFLNTILHLPALEEYDFQPRLKLKYGYGKANPDVYYFDKFLLSLCKKRNTLIHKDVLDQSHIELLCHLFREEQELLKQANKEAFYQILNSSVAKYRTLVLDYLNEEKRHLPNLQGKKVFILGKLKVVKADQEEWIAEIGAVLEKHFSSNIDYVLLGEKPGNKLSTILDAKVPILLEQDIWNLKDSAYLMNESSPAGNHLSDLLQSFAPENLEIVFQIMDKGGVPKEVLEEVIAIMLYHKDRQMRKRAKILFDRFASTDFSKEQLLLLNKSVYRIKEDKKTSLFLHQLIQCTSLNLDRLAYAVYRYSNKKHAQGLCLSTPGLCSKILPDYLDGDKLKLKLHDSLSTSDLYLERIPIDIDPFLSKIKILDTHKHLTIIDKKGVEYLEKAMEKYKFHWWK